MIVSHRHKYVFIQLDQTASTAMARELCQHYGGEPMLWKHARYCDFMKVATPEEKEYFFFSGVRNPMDALVSTYLRQKSDRNKRFSGRMEGTSKQQHQTIRIHQADECGFSGILQEILCKRHLQRMEDEGFRKTRPRLSL